jgi:hypothetical protein
LLEPGGFLAGERSATMVRCEVRRVRKEFRTGRPLNDKSPD